MTGNATPKRIDGLDVLRALAALIVVVCHAAARTGWTAGGMAWPFGRVGRQFFLVLSGFLLFLPYVRAAYAPRGTQPGFSPAAYALKRALRVLPLYFTAVLALSIWGFIGLYPGTAKNLVYHALFIHTFDKTTIYGLVAPLWFVGVIVQWYVALPFMGWLWLRLKHRLAVWVGATCVASALVYTLGVAFPSPPFALVAVVNKGLVGALPFLFAGMTAAALFVRARPRTGTAVRGLPIVLVVPVCLAVAAGLVVLRRYGAMSVAPFALAGVLLLCADASSGGRWLAPVRALGRASYSAFIWHVPVLIVVLKTGLFDRIGGSAVRALLLLAVALPLTFAVALISYRLLEKPFFTFRPAMKRRLLGRLGVAYSSMVITAAAPLMAGKGVQAQNTGAGTGRSTPPSVDADPTVPQG